MTPVSGQTRVKAYEEYAERYGDLAREHMDRYRVPASIKLAQAILESGGGLSELARQSNNHFGIKCHREWDGLKCMLRMMGQTTASASTSAWKIRIAITLNFW